MTTQTIPRRRDRRAQQRAAAARTPPTARTTAALYRHGWLAFAVFSLAVLIAFWPSYFSRLTAQPTFHAHAHGIAMSLWCTLLVAQAWLIRIGRRPLHRRIGVLSYLLAPAMVLTTINFVHFRMTGATRMTAVDLYFLALVINALVAFAALYGLAIVYKADAALHARYMVCTIFPLVTPVTDRLIGRHVPAIVPLVPRIDGTPVVPVAGFLLADALLVALCIWDRRAPRGRWAFRVALAVMLLYHASVLTFHRFAFWRAFAETFLGWDLS